MKQTYLVYAIFVFAVIMSITMPRIATIVYQSNHEGSSTYETQNKKQLSKAITPAKSTAKVATEASKVELAIATPTIKEEPKEEVIEENVETQKEEVKKEQVVLPPTKSYEEMTVEELVTAINNGTFTLEYSKVYNTNTSGLSKSKGAIYYNNHKETYYSERVLPGNNLNIPGRHVAEDGTVRDGDGYISVAANSSYLSKGTIVKTSLGPAKVYDSGCASGIVDIYTNW